MAIQTNRHFDRATAAVAIAHELVVDGVYLIEAVRVHLSAAGGAVENLVISNNAAAGAAYDTVFATYPMNALADVNYMPIHAIVLADGDTLTITYANTNLRTYGLEIVYREQA
jgi:hypothetical protein